MPLASKKSSEGVNQQGTGIISKCIPEYLHTNLCTYLYINKENSLSYASPHSPISFHLNTDPDAE